MGTRLDPLALVLGASIAVKAVLVILALFSIFCWALIAYKLFQLARTSSANAQFSDAYAKGSLDEVAAVSAALPSSGLAKVFSYAHSEAKKMNGGSKARLNDAEAEVLAGKSKRVAVREIHRLEQGLNALGTIGSTAPFIGLFGTVYGIMDAFLSIGNQGNANLPVVAPKIAEALIATGVGLVAAIPSVMAYNYFSRRGHPQPAGMVGFSG